MRRSESTLSASPPHPPCDKSNSQKRYTPHTLSPGSCALPGKQREELIGRLLRRLPLFHRHKRAGARRLDRLLDAQAVVRLLRVHGHLARTTGLSQLGLVHERHFMDEDAGDEVTSGHDGEDARRGRKMMMTVIVIDAPAGTGRGGAGAARRTWPRGGSPRGVPPPPPPPPWPWACGRGGHASWLGKGGRPGVITPYLYWIRISCGLIPCTRHPRMLHSIMIC
jgi:hypothetical protein